MGVVWVVVGGREEKKQWTLDAYQPSLGGGNCVIVKKIKRERHRKDNASGRRYRWRKGQRSNRR